MATGTKRFELRTVHFDLRLEKVIIEGMNFLEDADGTEHPIAGESIWVGFTEFFTTTNRSVFLDRIPVAIREYKDRLKAAEEAAKKAAEEAKKVKTV